MEAESELSAHACVIMKAANNLQQCPPTDQRSYSLGIGVDISTTADSVSTVSVISVLVEVLLMGVCSPIHCLI